MSVMHRRDLMAHAVKVAALLATAGLLPRAAQAAYNAAAFELKTLADVVKALGGRAPAESKDVALTGPDVAENGAAVPVVLSTTLPGAQRLLLLVEKNPHALSAVFELSDAVDASFSTRVKMAQSSHVYAVALMADGSALFARKDIRITLGGCGV